MSNHAAVTTFASSAHCSWQRRGTCSCAVKSGSCHRTQSIAMKYLPIPSARWLPLSAETVPRVFTTKQVTDIPLHLIPKTIADLIKGRRSPLYRITVTMAFKNGLRWLLRPANGNTGGLHHGTPSTRTRSYGRPNRRHLPKKSITTGSRQNSNYHTF